MKKTTNLVWSLFLIGASSISLNAQTTTEKIETTQFGKKGLSSEKEINTNIHRCLTEINEIELQKKYPNRLNSQQFETWLASEINKQKSERIKNGRSIDAVYNIPVVIHIIHNGDCVGFGENITDSQAISQITIMNNDFRRLAATPGGANSTGLAVDCEINFILAKRDPNGQPTTGVIRHEIAPYTNSVANGTGGADWELRTDVETMKAATQWDPTRYLNMWTIRPGGAALPTGLTGLLGYAQFPDATGLGGLNASGGASNTDGVVCAFDSMGSKNLNDGTFILNPGYDEGRTMTHEVGHWIGLKHIWGDDACPAGTTNVATNEDFVADTPASAAANYTCAVINSCTAIPGNDQVQNYMDYTPDACMDTFTAGQKARMQTIMGAAARRASLNTSNGATAPALSGIYIKPIKVCSLNEGTNCSFTDYTFKIATTKAPTATATVTLSVNGTSTATNTKDFILLSPTVTMPSGSATDQDFIVRVYNDGIAESEETIIINAAVNAGGGDAVLIADYSQIKFSIGDNDVAPSASYSITAVSENFNAGATLLNGARDLDGDTNNWGIGTSTNTIGFSDAFAFSRSWISPSTALSPDNILFSTATFTVPTGVSNLSFGIGTTQAAPYHLEHYSVYLTTINPATITAATLNAQTAVVNNAILAGGAQRNTINVNTSAYAGQSVYLIFRHHNTVDMNWIMLDDIVLSSSGNTLVQTELNAASKYQALIPQAGTFYANDTTIGNVMMNGTVNNFDHGCTSVEVTRSQTSAGAGALNYGSNTANNQKVMAKSFTVTTANNNTTGTGSATFYFTEAEVAAWEAATGNSRTALKVIKQGTASTLTTVTGTFGTNFSLTGTFANGINGMYYFGTDATLANSSFDFDNSIAIYPNPNNGVFNIQFTSQSSNLIKINVHDIRGREVYAKAYTNNGFFNEVLQLNQAQAGIYIVTIQDGDNKVMKKIIKE